MRGSAVIYKTATGSIERFVEGTITTFSLDCGEGEAWIEGEGSDTTHYVNLDADPVITPKGDYTLESLPLPCTVTIEGVEYAVTEQPTFSFNYPGTYIISVDAGVRYLQKEFEIDYQP